MSIAILGWGSLLWDGGHEFDARHGRWEYDGPTLKIEFSRVSKTRGDALTLVIDDQHGSHLQVAWCLSTRQTLEDAVCDLRCREQTRVEDIGYVRLHTQPPTFTNSPTRQELIDWGRQKNLDAIVWTTLENNFQNPEKMRGPFSVDAALAHLQSLDPAGKARAAEYVWRAPIFVKTPLRDTLQREPWFSEAKPL